MIEVVPIRLLAFVTLAACAAFGQRGEFNSLPEAPSAQTSPSVRQDENWIAKASLIASYREQADQNHSADFFRKYLGPSVTKKYTSDASSNGSVVGRATSAASKVVLTRDEAGKERLNTSYILRVLTSAIVHTAYRPYWSRPVGAPFSDFGSTIGNDAGMNVLHEFAPSLQQLVKSHTPKFVSKIEERVGR